MAAPFVFGKLASTSDFTDRKKDREHLLGNFMGLVNTAVISPRRWGKSSLVNKVVCELLSKHKKDFIAVQVDVFNCRNEEAFFNTYANAVMKAGSSKLAEFTATVTRFLGKFAPQISMSDTVGSYELSFGIDFKEQKRSFDEILDLPQMIAKEKNKKVIVCIDEFQTIADYDNTLSFQRRLRAHWQTHGDVAYCLYGSKRGMMVDIFGNADMPFYKFGDIMFLDKIARADWVKFITKRFADTGKKISEELAGTVADLAENHPYYVQQISQLAWFRTKRVCTAAIIDEAFSGLVCQLSLLFATIIDDLTPRQIHFLQAVADGVKNFSSAAVLKKYDLGTSANIKNLKESTEKKELISILPTGIEIQDPILKHWLLNDFGK